ncbi:MAG: PQQ-binding-like beta-propeller repeat protein [Thermoanaerobaculia bacterium]
MRARVATAVLLALVAITPAALEAQCTTAPTFGGIDLVTNPGGSTCTLQASWNPGTDNCGGTVTYNVYRSTTNPFAPSVSNRIAFNVTGTSYTDTADLAQGVTYYYMVRAMSSVSWAEETNTAWRDGTPTGTLTTAASDNFEATNPQWDASVWPGGSDANVNTELILSNCLVHSGTTALRFGPANCGKYNTKEDNRLILGGSSGIAVPVSAKSVRLRFWHAYDFQSVYDGVRLYYTTTNPFNNYADVSTYQGMPDTPTPGAPYIENEPYNTSIAFWQNGVSTNRPAWNGAHYTYSDVTVNLDGIQGQNLWLIWRFKTDQTGDKGYGYNLDDLSLTYGTSASACTTSPSPLRLLTATSKAAAAGANGAVKLEWAATPGSTIKIYRSAGATAPATPDPVAYRSTVTTDATGYGSFSDPGLTTSQKYSYSAFVSSGTSYSSQRSVTTIPPDSATKLKWRYQTGATALTPPTVFNAVFAVSNDRFLHGMNVGATGGDWPRGSNWIPPQMNAPSQGRVPVVPMSLHPVTGPSGPATNVVFVATQDGRVYCFNADSGAQQWMTQVSGATSIVAPVTYAMRQYGFSTLSNDLLFVGTRNSSGTNAMVALDAQNGTERWRFTNSAAQGGNGQGIGIITAMPAIDVQSRTLIFTSRTLAGGSSNTVWALSFDATTPHLTWSAAIGDAETTPMTRNGVVYVGNNSGQVYAYPVGSFGTAFPLWSYDTFDGPVKTYVYPDWSSNRLYFCTTNRVWALVDNGAGAVSLLWSTPGSGAGSVAYPSNIISTPTDAWVGSSSGELVKFAGSDTASPAQSRITLSTGSVGAPIMDYRQGAVCVGTEEGAFFAVAP